MIKGTVQTGVVELAGNGRVYRNLLRSHGKGIVIALPLFANIPQGILSTALVVLVENHHVGVIDHVDLFQLARRAVVAGHDIEREIHQIDNLGITLADTGGLHQHQIVAEGFQEQGDIAEHLTGGQVLATGRHGAHINLW